MSTHRIGFYEEMTKIIFQLLLNIFICSSGFNPNHGCSVIKNLK